MTGRVVAIAAVNSPARFVGPTAPTTPSNTVGRMNARPCELVHCNH